LFNHIFFSEISSQGRAKLLNALLWRSKIQETWLIFLAAGFLVSVPVFIQAPLVRFLPWLSLVLTGGWLGLGWILYNRPKTRLWGDLLIGFSWSWLAGSIYWGWLRYDPLIHLPVESIGVPFAIWCLVKGWGKVGNWFYLGSLLGTAITDLYFYLTNVIPHWRKLMIVDPAFVTPILQSAIAQVQTPWGFSWAVILGNLLLGIGLWSLQKKELHWWAFGGAVFSTILVDSIFWLAISFA
jgi:hypothetical protein